MMKAITSDRRGLNLVSVPKPIRTHGQALIRVLMAGICNTDLEICRGYMGFTGIPGHEFVGIVEESDNPALNGKRVVGEINCGCTACDWCHRGLSRHCPDRTVVGILNHPGAFAQYLVLPEENLHLVPATLRDTLAVFTEPLAAALEICQQVHLDPGMTACVIGDGKLGLLVAWTLRNYIRRVHLVGKYHSKIALAQGSQIICWEKDQPPGQLFPLVVEASGSASGWKMAMKLIEPRGTLVLKSTYAGELTFQPAPIVIQEYTVIGSRCGPFEPALDLLERNVINPEPLISAIYPYHQFQKGFDHARSGDSLKILLDFRPSPGV